VSHIFISYDHDDSDYAHRLEGELRLRGFEVWIDERIAYGTRWPQVIEEQVDTCAAMIVIMTPRSKESDWVQNELAYAKNLRKPLFPVLLEGDYWLSVSAIQCVDVRDGQLPPARFYDWLAQAVPSVARQPFEPEMILIPAGKFLMGSDPRKDADALENERPQHRLYLPDYHITRTPVTNAQYLAFVQAARYRQPVHWEDGKPPQGMENHPVVHVSWHDARAYCRWLTQITGRRYSLPSEAEWEKAARGADGRIYPWGDDPPDESRCNFADPERGPTPVGAYSPQGDSPYGCADVAGNVWEWTGSLWGRAEDKPDFGYPYDADDGREDLDARKEALPVVRGGSFSITGTSARCAHRYWCYPDGDWHLEGFRVVSPIAP
jgi:serine/threonine-protein kinase